jgi:NADPH:quinone reductase-like Zn-dependent oxidoreductase
MSIPAIQKQWLISSTGKNFDSLVYQDAPLPKVGDNDVLVRLHGASLNYRDLLIPQVHPLAPPAARSHHH